MSYSAPFELTKGTKDSAGYDIVSPETVILPALSSRIVNTKLRIIIPTGYFGLIKSRSGMAFKRNIDTCNSGIIDSDYRGEIMIKFYNHNKIDYKIMKGDKIAQIIFLRYFDPILKKITIVKDDKKHEGFGSTDKGKM